jgi:hypothetical protein
MLIWGCKVIFYSLKGSFGMQKNIVMGAIRAANLRNFVIGIVLLALVAGGMLIAKRYLVSLFSGPQTISSNDLVDLTDAEELSNYWVTVTGREAIDTGGEEYVSSTGQADRVTARYVMLIFKDHFMLVKVPASVPIDNLPDTFTGAIVPIPPSTEQEIARPLRRDLEDQDIDGELLPFMMDASDFTSDGKIGLVIAAVTGLIAVFLLARGLMHTVSPKSHPYYTRLKRFGDPETVMHTISSEVASDGQNIGGSLITPNWLVHPKSSSFSAVPFKDVAWAYMKVIQRRVNGVPAGKTYQACVWDRHGKQLNITASQENVQRILSKVALQAPWALLGHDPNIDKMWHKKRAEILSAVDQRREQILQSQGEGNPLAS